MSNCAFVISEVSASAHEVSANNAYVSGSAALETSPVPASGTLYYSKQSRFVSLTYKLSASSGMTVIPGNERGPSQLENKPRNTFSSISGSYRNNSYFNPAIFNINVPDYGRIRSVRVWLELVHDHRGGTGTGSADASNPFYGGGSGSSGTDTRTGLQGLQVALRSPNSTFQYAHPLWNDRYVRTLPKGPSLTNSTLGQVPELLKNSYLLWAGHAVEDDLGWSLMSATSSAPDNKNTFETIAFTVSGSFGTFMDMTIDQYDRIHVVYQARDSGSVMYASSSLTAPDWSITRLSGGAGFGIGGGGDTPNIAVGKSNTRHISYIDDNTQKLVYVKITGTFDPGVGINKTFVNVDTTLSPNYNDISLDANDAPCIAYATTFTQEIYLARSGSTGFVLEKVSPTLVPRFGPVQLVFDQTGSPNVFYTKQGPGTGNTIIHARSGSNGWKEYLIYSASVVPGKRTEPVALQNGFFSIVQDSNGNLHGQSTVQFFDSDDVGFAQINRYGGTVYLRSGSNGWIPELVLSSSVRTSDSGNSSDQYTTTYRSLGVGTDGVPHIAIQRLRGDGSGYDEIMYARSSSIGWSSQNISKGANTPNNFFGANRPVLSLDRNNNPHMIWKDRENSSNPLPGSTGSIEYVRLVGVVSSSAYQSFDTDIDMRTVFDDGSPYINPRHIQGLYTAPGNSNPGVSQFPSLRLRTGGSYASPLSGAVALFAPSSSFRYLRPTEGGAPIDQMHFMTGANFPWMLDSRIPPGGFVGRQYSATASLPPDVSSSYAIPRGWLNGVGGTNATNEWPTVGIQLGPSTLKPVYPMLDDVIVEKIIDQPPFAPSGLDNSVIHFPATLPVTRPRVIGFRPGLRGTEIHGNWQLLIGNTWASDPNNEFNTPATGSVRGGWWFRQLRLEFLVDQNRGLQSDYPGRLRKYSKPAQVPSLPGKRRIAIVSGSAEWDIGTNYVYAQTNDEYGRSVGITDSSGSSDFAVYTRLTGALAVSLSASGQLDQVEATFLKNEFGTPFIPISSGSGEAPTFEAYTSADAVTNRQIFQEVLNPRPLVSRDNTLRAFLARSGTTISTRESILRKVTK